MASDLAAIRAEGRRLMAAMEAPADDDPDWIVATDAFGKWMYDHASDLLADPAPSVPVEQPPPTCGDSDHRHYGPCEVYATASPVVEAGEADRPATPSGAAQLSEEEAEADRAALASPEGVVTLPKLGQRVRITTDDGMDHAHWRDGECGGERCLGDRSWANYDDARLLAQLQRVKRQEQSDD